MKIIGYKLSDNFLKKQLIDFKKLKDIDFTFQEYIESMYAPTVHLSEFFSKNNLPFNQNITEEISTKRKFEIANLCIKEFWNQL